MFPWAFPASPGPARTGVPVAVHGRSSARPERSEGSSCSTRSSSFSLGGRPGAPQGALGGANPLQGLRHELPQRGAVHSWAANQTADGWRPPCPPLPGGTSHREERSASSTPYGGFVPRRALGIFDTPTGASQIRRYCSSLESSEPTAADLGKEDASSQAPRFALRILLGSS
jgi:hypothetical protein